MGQWEVPLQPLPALLLGAWNEGINQGALVNRGRGKWRGGARRGRMNKTGWCLPLGALACWEAKCSLRVESNPEGRELFSWSGRGKARAGGPGVKVCFGPCSVGPGWGPSGKHPHFRVWRCSLCSPLPSLRAPPGGLLAPLSPPPRPGLSP